MLRASAKQRTAAANINLKKGRTVEIENQRFTGYTMIASNTDEINIGYMKLRAMYSAARHIICSYRLPGVRFHQLQDFFDDDEHFAGAFLLKFLEDSNISNRAVFVVREYDGSHIGKARYDAMLEAVKAAILAAPYNTLTGEFQCPWADVQQVAAQFQAQNNAPIRGGMSARGHLRKLPQQQQYAQKSGLRDWNTIVEYGKESWSEAEETEPYLVNNEPSDEGASDQATTEQTLVTNLPQQQEPKVNIVI